GVVDVANPIGGLLSRSRAGVYGDQGVRSRPVGEGQDLLGAEALDRAVAIARHGRLLGPAALRPNAVAPVVVVGEGPAGKAQKRNSEVPSQMDDFGVERAAGRIPDAVAVPNPLDLHAKQGPGNAADVAVGFHSHPSFEWGGDRLSAFCWESRGFYGCGSGRA